MLSVETASRVDEHGRPGLRIDSLTVMLTHRRSFVTPSLP